MALQTLPRAIIWPGNVPALNAQPALGTAATLDAAGEYLAVVMTATVDMVISHAGLRPGTVVGSGAGTIRIETVDTAGDPSGSLWAANTEIATGALTSNTWGLYALTASATISKGQRFAVKIVYTSGTSFIVQQLSGPFGNSINMPYNVSNTTGSAVHARQGGPILAVLGSNSTTFYSLFGLAPLSAYTNAAFNNTNSEARAARFQVPFKCRCSGIQAFISSTLGNFNYGLMDDSGSVLSSSDTAHDGDFSAASNTAIHHLPFDSPVTLSPVTTYKAYIEPSSATNCTLGQATLPSADYRSGWPGGTNFHYAVRTSGTWDDTQTTVVPMIDILIDQLDDGVNSGGVPMSRVFGGM